MSMAIALESLENRPGIAPESRTPFFPPYLIQEHDMENYNLSIDA